MRVVRHWSMTLTATLALVVLVPTARPADEKKEKLAEQVKKAIEKGVQFLRDQEKGRGHWEVDLASPERKGGWTGVALLALLNAGVPVDDPMIKRGLEWLRKLPSEQTYSVSLQTMVLALAGQKVDKERIQKNVDWLVAARLEGGWSYTDKGGVADNSNTQYALLALHDAIRAGATVDEKVIKEIRQMYVRTQQDDGGWIYRRGGPTTMTMTTAGLCGLIITGMDQKANRQKLNTETGVAERCGEYEDNEPVAKALQWVSAAWPPRLTIDLARKRLVHVFYALYGIERAGRLTGQRFFNDKDWYRIGCEYLVGQQKPNGSWEGAQLQFDYWPVVSTSLSLLFLSKGRTPVLVSKWAHGPARSEDWNNKRHDARNLVEFTSRELFRGQPLAWQVFDARQVDAPTPESRQDLAAELLQSPVLYVNGHTFPSLRKGDKEADVLREFVENGGFIFAEACCGADAGGKQFDRRFRAFVSDVLEGDLKPLDPKHPVYTASGKFAVSAADFPLEGVQKGCKTVVIYSPKPVSGYWEENLHKDGRGRKAFQLGANVLAYATGLEMPRPRLTEVEISKDDPDKQPVKRGYLKVAQLRHGGDWQPAPRAMRNLMEEARKTGLDVVLKTRDVGLTSETVMDYRFFYMHGRSDFSATPDSLKHLRFNLETGGTLLADACCGGKAFDTSFRKFVEALGLREKGKDGKVETKTKLEPIPVDDELFGKELNGAAIKTVRCRHEPPAGQPVDPEYREVAPALEGIKINGRWAVIYSRYDLGCALERHKSSDCLGHDYDSAARLGKAAVLYSMKR